MNGYECFLVSVKYNDGVMKCALKIPTKVMDKYRKFYSHMPVNYQDSISLTEAIQKYLPLHVKDAGPIESIERIFEVVVIEESK